MEIRKRQDTFDDRTAFSTSQFLWLFRRKRCRGGVGMKVFDAGQLRIARRNAGFTIRDAAKLLFFSVSSVASKENGIVRVFADELPAFSNLYNVSVENFFVEKIDGHV